MNGNTHPAKPILFKVIRTDGVTSKPMRMSAIVAAYKRGSLRDDWIVVNLKTQKRQTVAELIGKLEFQEQLKSSEVSPPTTKPTASRKRHKDAKKETKAGKLPESADIIRRPEQTTRDGQPDVQSDIRTECFKPDDPITVHQLKEFSNHLPQRKIAIRLGGVVSQAPFTTVAQLVNTSGMLDWVVICEHDTEHVLRMLEKRNGWLCLTFGSQFEAISEYLMRHSDVVIDTDVLRELFAISNRLLAIAEAGITDSECRQLLARLLEFEGGIRFLRANTDQMVLVLVRNAVQALKSLSAVLGQSPAIVAPRVMPVAMPTVGATLDSIMNAAIFNFGFSLIDNVIEGVHRAELNQTLRFAIRIFHVLRVLSAFRLQRP